MVGNGEMQWMRRIHAVAQLNTQRCRPASGEMGVSECSLCNYTGDLAALGESL